jgi:hypothetical protein
MSFVMSDAIRMAASLVPGLPGSDLPVRDFPFGAQEGHQVTDGRTFVDGEPGSGALRLQGVDEAIQPPSARRRLVGRGAREWREDGREGRPEEPRAGAIPPDPTAHRDEKPRPDVR